MESKGGQNTSLKIHFQITARPRTIFTESCDNSTDYLVNMENAVLRNSESQKKINFWFIIAAWLCLQSRIIWTELVCVDGAQGCARALGNAAALHATPAFRAPQVTCYVGTGGVPVPHGRGPWGFAPKNHSSHIAGVHTFLLVGFLLFLGTTGNIAHSALTSGWQLPDQCPGELMGILLGIQHLAAIFLIKGHELPQLLRQSIDGLQGLCLHSHTLPLSDASGNKTLSNTLVLAFKIAGDVLWC